MHPLGTLARFAKIPIVLTLIVSFFFIYNTFLVDTNIEQLRFSLEQTAQAYDISDLDGVDLLLNQLMIDEIVPEKVNLLNVANLEYARNAIEGKKNFKVIDSVKTSLGAIIKEKEKGRNKALILLDKVNRAIMSFFGKITKFISGFFTGKKQILSKGDVIKLNEAQALERVGKLDKALVLYKELIAKNPLYEKLGLIQLRVANIYHRVGQYKKASTLYKSVVKAYRGRKEAYIAQMMLVKLEQMDKIQAKANLLLMSIVDPKNSNPKVKQNILYQLGALNLALYNMEDSKKYFERAVKVNPEGDLALKAKFVSGWVSKEEKRLVESAKVFSMLVKEYPNSTIALDSRYQLADICQKEGRYQEAADIYVKLADEYKGDPVASLCLFQAAASYMYDLNDDEKAKELFARLIREHPNTPYAKYVSPDNPIGIFITYLVPRATRVVAWRVGALLSLSGYSGKVVKFVDKVDVNVYNRQINAWLKSELPDTIGNLYVDMKGVELKFKPGKAGGSGRFVIGKFSVFGEAEGELRLDTNNVISLNLTKTMIENIPIPPQLISRSLTQISYIMAKHFPICFTKVSMNQDEIIIEGYASERVIRTMARRTRQLLGEITYQDITDYKERKIAYDMMRKKFPENDFSASPKRDHEAMFLDFFTRMQMYVAYKILETVKDTKLDYERSVRELGRLTVKKSKFRVSYTDKEVTTNLNKLIKGEFPWLIDGTFLIDLKGAEIRFTNDGDIKFFLVIVLDEGSTLIKAEGGNPMKIMGKARLVIDKESNIPRLIFKEILLDGKRINEEKFNLVTERGLNILKDSHLPFELENVAISEGRITLTGIGARDFTARLFSDPNLFEIFRVREWDISIAGIQRQRSLLLGVADTISKNANAYLSERFDTSEKYVRDKYFDSDLSGKIKEATIGEGPKVGSGFGVRQEIDESSEAKEGSPDRPGKDIDRVEDRKPVAPEGELDEGEWKKGVPTEKEFAKSASLITEVLKPTEKSAENYDESKEALKSKEERKRMAGREGAQEEGEYVYLGGKKEMPAPGSGDSEGAILMDAYKNIGPIDPQARKNIEDAIKSLTAANEISKGDKKIENINVLLKMLLQQSSAKRAKSESDTVAADVFNKED